MMEFRGCDGTLLGTLYQCKRCPARFKVKGVFAQLGGREQSRHVDTLLKYHKGHACAGVLAVGAAAAVTAGTAIDEPYLISDSGDDEPNPSSTWTPAAVRAVDWTRDELEGYLFSHDDEEAPELFKMTAYNAGQQDGNPFYCCVFRHPTTSLLSPELWLSSTVLHRVPRYKPVLDEAAARFEVEAWTAELLDSVVRECEYYEPPPKKQAKSTPAAFGRANRTRHPRCAYEALLRLLRDAYQEVRGRADAAAGTLGARCCRLPRATLASLAAEYNLEDYAPPTAVPSCPVLADAAKTFGMACKAPATLLVKPTALHAWLALCAARATESGGSAAVVRLALCRDLDPAALAAVAVDPYGFNTLRRHAVRLSLWPANGDSVVTAASGVLCAVLTRASLAEPTPAYTLRPRSLCADLIVHDPRLVLVLGTV